MVKRLFAAALALWLCAASASAELKVERKEGDLYFPSEKDWVYHFTYAYPRVAGDDYTAALINDTYQMALDEMTNLVLPMFANAPDMRFDGKNEVNHDFTVYCNDGRLLSILQTRRQEMGEETMLSLEPLTFDVQGMYAGESLTLRGVMLVLAGVDAEALEDVSADQYPEVRQIIEGSSSSIAETLLPVLYERFLKEYSGIVKECSLEDFDLEFSAARDFAADAQGNLLFFFPPMLMREPGKELVTITMTVPEIEALLAAAPKQINDADD